MAIGLSSEVYPRDLLGARDSMLIGLSIPITGQDPAFLRIC